MKRQMFSLFFVSVCISVSFVFASCSTGQAEPQLAANQETGARTKDVGADTSPFTVVAPQSRSCLDAAAGTALSGITDLSLRVLRSEREAGKSIVFSPLSLGYAMGIVGLACDGVPLQQLNALLGLEPTDRTTLPDLCATLMTALPEADSNVSLNLANAFYLNAARPDVKLNPDYRAPLLGAFAADCEALDFTTQEALDYINSWCSRQTDGFIPKVLDKLNPEAISYLLNALYFKAKWLMPFMTELTHDADFRLENGATKTVRMMHQWEPEYFPYTETGAYQAASLRYAMGRYSMTVLLPKAGTTVGDILDGLTAQAIDELSAAMGKRWERLLCSMPKFETKVNTNLVEVLAAQGLPSWFDQSCAIRGAVQNLDGTPHGVYVSEMFQVARIRVNEEGTEAAAVTVGSFADGMSPDEPLVFCADHPFVYFIREQDTGAVLFVGCYEGDDDDASTCGTTGIRDIRM